MSHKGTKSEWAYHKTRSSLLHSAPPNLYLAKYKLGEVVGSRLLQVFH